MKRFVITGMFILAPTLVESVESFRHVSTDNRIVNRGVKKSDLSQRIERFAVKNGASPTDAPVIGALLARQDHPRIMAAIAAKESRFDVSARGKSGEIGMYQVIPQYHGHPGCNIESQTEKTAKILDELASKSNGNLRMAVRKYNGAGRKAERYADHVMRMASSI